MWTKNGAKTLDLVLKRINKVIPKECVNYKYIIDDDSTDNTRNIAIENGWIVLFNKGKGISDGANTALIYVNTEYFCSFEQDVLLDENWWKQIPLAFKNPNVVVSSGFRLPNKPEYLVKLQEYTMQRYIEKSKKPLFFYGRNLDNTMYKTSIIRAIGGFPYMKNSAGVDNILAKKIIEAGHAWSVNFNVISTHIRNGFIDELKHYYWYGTCYSELKKYLGQTGDSLQQIFLRTLFSPLRAAIVAYKQKSPQILFAYPTIRATILLGCMNPK